MAKVDELVVEIKGDIKDLTKKLDGALKETKKATDGMGGAFSSLNNPIGKAAVALGAFGLAAEGAKIAMTPFISAIQRMSEKGFLLRTSKQLGINVEKFQEFSFAARSVGVETVVMADAIKDLNVKITDTAKNGGVLEDALKQLGLEAKNLVKLTPDQQFEKFADAISKADENLARFALDEINDSMFQLFNLVRGGSEALNGAAKEARELNQVFTEMELKKMEQVSIEAGKIKAGFVGLLDEALIELAPLMKQFLETTLKGIKELNKLLYDEPEGINKVMDPESWAEATEASKAFWSAQKEGATSFPPGPFAGAISGGTSRADDEEAALGNVAVTGQDVMSGMPWWMTEEGQSQADAARELEIEKQEEFNKRLRDIEEYTQEYNRRLWESGWKGKAEIASQVMGQVSKLMNSESRKMFEVGKAAAKAQVLVDTPKAAMSAYSAMAGIPYIGPSLGAAAAAAAIASGAAQMQKIDSTQFGGSGNSGGGGISSDGAAGSAEASGPQEIIQTTNFDVTLQGDSFSGEQVRGLIGAINEETDDNVQLNAVMAK
jgi:hypothetical protein